MWMREWRGSLGKKLRRWRRGKDFDKTMTISYTGDVANARWDKINLKVDAVIISHFQCQFGSFVEICYHFLFIITHRYYILYLFCTFSVLLDASTKFCSSGGDQFTSSSTRYDEIFAILWNCTRLYIYQNGCVAHDIFLEILRYFVFCFYGSIYLW